MTTQVDGWPHRVLRTPFVEQDNLYKAYIEAEGTGVVTDVVVPAFLHPEDVPRKRSGAGVQNFAANLRN